MSVDDAVHKTVHAAGGSKVVADRLVMPAGVVRAKANPNDRSRGFYLPEAVELMSLTGDHRILSAMADEFGYQLRPLGDVDPAGRALVGLVTDAVFGGLDEADIRHAVTALRAKSADMRQSIYGLQEVLARLAKETGKEVYAGPIEATALGNLMAQMLKDKVFEDLPAARQTVARSFDVKKVNEE